MTAPPPVSTMKAGAVPTGFEYRDRARRDNGLPALILRGFAAIAGDRLHDLLPKLLAKLGFETKCHGNGHAVWDRPRSVPGRRS